MHTPIRRKFCHPPPHHTTASTTTITITIITTITQLHTYTHTHIRTYAPTHPAHPSHHTHTQRERERERERGGNSCHSVVSITAVGCSDGASDRGSPAHHDASKFTGLSLAPTRTHARTHARTSTRTCMRTRHAGMVFGADSFGFDGSSHARDMKTKSDIHGLICEHLPLLLGEASCLSCF